MAVLSTPLHLAASLLALSAAVGLAVAALAQRRQGGVVAGLVAAGALVFAAGHGLSGALLEVGDAGAWLRAAGLVLVAAGATPTRLAGSAVLVPLAPLSAAVVAAAAGALAGLRVAAGGARTMLAGLGLALWGLAELAAQASPFVGAVLTLGGSVAVGGWLWQVSARRLQAKFANAFVGVLLAVVVLVAGILSGIGSTQLVDEELGRLTDISARLGQEIGTLWPQEAVAAARPLRNSGTLLLSIDPDDEARLREINDLSFRDQDFFALVGSDGRLISAHSEEPSLLSSSFLLPLVGSEPVDRMLAGASEDGGVITLGGRLVAVGGVRLVEAAARAEDPALGVIVTGRIVDDVWAEATAAGVGAGIAVEVGGELAVASEEADAVARPALAALGSGGDRSVLEIDDRAHYVASAPVRDRGSAVAPGRLLAVSTADVIAAVEREQSRQLFVLALLGALFAALVGVVLTGRLVAPLRRLTETAEAVGAGDLDARAGLGAPDEVGQLGRTFDTMTSSLAQQAARLREAADTEARLRGRLEALTASMGDALIAVDTDGIVVTFNNAAETLTGHDAEAVLGRRLEEVVSGTTPDGRDAVTALGAAASDASASVQLLLQHRRGTVVPTAATAAPVRDDAGTVLGRVLVLRDVSREAEIDRMKSEFLSNVSHELRTPLTPIKGYAEILARRDVDPDKARRYADQILSSAVQLERIVGMIVDFAALDSGRIQLRREPTSLSGLVGETLDDWRGRHPRRSFRRRVAKTLPPVLADPRMLRRCLDELLDNAVKFSPNGEPVSIVATVDESLNGRPGRVRLSVRDRGIGFELDDATELFGDFYQSDGSETRAFGGLGLGLALVRRILDGIGGQAVVESAPDEGTTFHLLLPRADEEGEVVRSPRRDRTSSRS